MLSRLATLLVAVSDGLLLPTHAHKVSAPAPAALAQLRLGHVGAVPDGRERGRRRRPERRANHDLSFLNSLLREY